MANKTTFRKTEIKKRERKENKEPEKPKRKTITNKVHYSMVRAQWPRCTPLPTSLSSSLLYSHLLLTASPVPGSNICHGCWLACSAAPRVALASAIRRPLHLSRLHDCHIQAPSPPPPPPLYRPVGHIHVSHLPLKFWWHDKSAAAADNVPLLH